MGERHERERKERCHATQGVSARAAVDGDLHRECGLGAVVLDEDTCRVTARERSVVHPCRWHHHRGVGLVLDAALDGVGVGKLLQKATAMDRDLPAWQVWLLMDWPQA
eukprot:scaffold6082_cov51-Phaeocystis_antarctica.AAC.6